MTETLVLERITQVARTARSNRFGHAAQPRLLPPRQIQSSLWPASASILQPEVVRTSAASQEDCSLATDSPQPPRSPPSDEDWSSLPHKVGLLLESLAQAQASCLSSSPCRSPSCSFRSSANTTTSLHVR